MSLQDYYAAKTLIEANGGDFVGPRPEAFVALAERALGLTFPPSYRRFLLDLGCGDIGGFEVYGIVDDDFEKSSVPDGIWHTLRYRKKIDLDHRYIIVESVGDGTYIAIDTAKVGADSENPIVRLTILGQPFEDIAPTFGAYILDSVQRAIE